MALNQENYPKYVPAARTCMANTYLLRTGVKQASHFMRQSANGLSHDWSQSEQDWERSNWFPRQVLQASWLWRRCQAQAPKGEAALGTMSRLYRSPAWRAVLHKSCSEDSLFWHNHIQALQLRAAGQSRVKTEGTLAAFLYKKGAGKLVTASQTETSKLLIAFTNSQVLKSTLFVKTC